MTTSDEDKDEFGGWDDEQDQILIEKAKKKQFRRKGRDPRTVKTGQLG